MVEKVNRLFWHAILVFVITIPISQFVSTRILVLLSVISVLLRYQKFFFYEFLMLSWDILLYLSIVTIGIFYSSNTAMGLSTLETSFAFLAMPIIFYKFSFDRERLNKIFQFLSFGIFGAGLICLMIAILKYFSNDNNAQLFFFYDFTKIINSHPTYFAYHLIFAVTYGLYYLNYERNKLSVSAIILFILFCFFILLLTGGQSAFVGMLFIFSFFILKFFLGQSAYLNKLTFPLVIIMLISIFLVNIRDQLVPNQILNDSWDRFDLWRSAILANSDPILGVGTGDSKSVLNEYFRETNQDSFAAEGLNAHNQFIQILLSNGIFGLLSVLILILRPLYLAFKNNDQMGILMIFPFLIYGMTEVFLGRYQGVVFFALLHQVFISHYLFNKKQTEVNGNLL